MEKMNLSQMKLTPLTTCETTRIQGGSFWGSFRTLTRTVGLIADMVMAEPIRQFSRSLAGGLRKGME